MTLRTAFRSAAFAALLITLDSAQLGCGQSASPGSDAPSATAPTPAPPAPLLGPRTAFGQISPQGGTITGVFGSGGAITGGSNGGVVYLSMGSCPEGQAWVSLGSGSGYACASAGTPSTAGSGDLIVQGSGELDAYAGSDCGSGLLVQSIDSAGDLGCALPIASNVCASGWADAIGSDGTLACSIPTAADVGAVSGTGTSTHFALWTGTGTIGASANNTDNGATTTIGEALTVTGAAQVHGLTSTASAIVQGNVGATTYIESFTNSSGAITSSTAGLGTNDLWFQGTNAASTGQIDDVGYNAGTTQPRSLKIDDGEGSGSAHTIGLFDASTHGLFIGSGNTSAELTYSTGTLVDSGNLEINGNLQGDSDALIDGELTVQGGADVEGGNVTINTSGTSTTTIGNSSGGAVKIDAGTGGVSICTLSSALGNCLIGSAGGPTTDIESSLGVTIAGSAAVPVFIAGGGGSAVLGTSTSKITFDNGPRGINGYGGVHYENNEEWDTTPVDGPTTGSLPAAYPYLQNGIWQLFSSLASCGEVYPIDGAGRPGVQEFLFAATGAACGAGYAGSKTGDPTFRTSGQTTTLEIVGGLASIGTTTTSSSLYMLAGFADGVGSSPHGCFWLYDPANQKSLRGATGTGTLTAVCANGASHTAYDLAGTGTCDGSFARGTASIGAVTFPNTNVFHLRIVESSTEADFYTVSGTTATKVCQITSNLPPTTTGIGAWWIAGSTVTSTATIKLDKDYTGFSWDLTSARSP